MANSDTPAIRSPRPASRLSGLRSPSPFWRGLLTLLVPLALFAAILLIQSPYPFRPISLTIRYSFLAALAAVGLLVYAALLVRGWLGNLVTFALVSGLFALTLLALWSSGQTTSTVFSGLLPVYDQANYYQDALRLLAGGRFIPFSSWRPLFPSLLSLLLGLTGDRLPLTLALLTLMAAIAVYLLTREVQRAFGPLAAAAAFLVLFFYYRQRISGMLMSEQLGLSLGALGLGMLLRAASSRAGWLAVLGAFILGLGLNARPGAFFVLPAVLLWVGWAFRGSRRYHLKLFLLASVAVAASFAVNVLVQRQVQSASSMLFSNFAYTLYGLVTGGTSFSSLFTDHPELTNLPGNERFLRAYGVVLEAFLRDPTGIFRGAWKEWSRFLSNTGYSVFSYFSAESTLVTTLARLGLYALSVLGLAAGVLRRRSPLYGLFLAAVLGVFLSVPFVPPGDAYGLRLYAATLPVIALVPALGAAFALEPLFKRYPRLMHRPRADAPAGIKTPLVAVPLFLTLLVLTAPPLVIHGFARTAPAVMRTCPAGMDRLVVRLNPASSVNIWPEGSFFLDRLPDYHFGRYLKQVHGLPDSDLADLLDTVETPVSFYQTIDVTDYRSVWLELHGYAFRYYPGYQLVCGYWRSEYSGTRYDLFTASEMYPLP